MRDFMMQIKTEVGIPVYNAVDTLPRTLESLVNQTISDFGICLSIDGDERFEEYLDIANEFSARGLNIRTIYNNINSGPGIARQNVLNTTEAEYLIYLDADDLLTPRAVEVLTYAIEQQKLDIVRAAYIKEERGKIGQLIPQNSGSITHFHGKIYRVEYLKKNEINFLPNLRYNEDSYFNLVAWNSTEARGEVAEPMYIWRENDNSITRVKGEKAFFIISYYQYIYSQVEGLKKLNKINGKVSNKLLTATLCLLYSNYMRARLYELPIEETEASLMTLRDEEFVQTYLLNYNNWVDVIQQLHAGEIYDNTIVFYKEPFNEWIARLIKKEKENTDSNQ